MILGHHSNRLRALAVAVVLAASGPLARRGKPEVKGRRRGRGSGAASVETAGEGGGGLDRPVRPGGGGSAARIARPKIGRGLLPRPSLFKATPTLDR